MNVLLIASRAQSRRRAVRPPSARAAAGFSLVETMMVVVIASGLAAMAVPPLRTLADSIRLTSASNALLAHLYLARSEAIKRNARVVLCKSTDGVSCAPFGGWEQGRVVFHDANNNGLLDFGEQVLAIEAALHPELRLVGNQNVARYVSFDASGSTKLVGGGFQAGTLTLCRHASSPGEGRLIVLNAAGRPRVRKSVVDACV